MSTSFIYKPLGLILKEADLISLPQIELALIDQSYYQDLKIGEIMALRGWIQQNTADFFAQEWSNLVQEQPSYPLGYYLQQAALLTEKQITLILQEQNQLWLRFGSVAVLKGWIKPNTLDFFLQYLFPRQLSQSPFIGKRKNIAHQSLSTNLNQSSITEIDDEDIPWID